MAPLPGDDIRALIEGIADGDDDAWAAFVARFAPVILQAARCIERDADAAGDAPASARHNLAVTDRRFRVRSSICEDGTHNIPRRMPSIS